MYMTRIRKTVHGFLKLLESRTAVNTTLTYYHLLKLMWLIYLQIKQTRGDIRQSSQKNTEFVCDCCGQKSLIMQHVFLKNAMEYVGYLCNLLPMKPGTCKNCSLIIKSLQLFDDVRVTS